jgi:tetratricopeptide (TPR) repeat protein
MRGKGQNSIGQRAKGKGHSAWRKAYNFLFGLRFTLLRYALCTMFYALCPVLVCYANDINSRFYSANSYYEQANYDEAIKQYNRILESGWESGNLYYNLGNCYFKKGELGRAILNYEKALRVIPLDRDLGSNYEYARSLIKSGTATSKKSLPLGVLSNLFEKFTIDGLTILLSVCFILILVNILISFFFGVFKKQALILTALLGLFFVVGFVGLQGKISLLSKEAIVIVEQAGAKFEPMDKATTYFTLSEGMKVEIIAAQDNWYKVKRQDNKSGWVESKVLAIF